MQSYNEAVFLLFQATLLCNGSSVGGSRRILQLGHESELSDNHVATILATICVYCNYIYIYISIATMEEEIVGVSVRLNQAIRQQCPKHRHS